MRFFEGIPGTFTAYVFAVLLWLAKTPGLIKVVNLDKAKGAIELGNILFICNHPTLFETIVLPAFFWPYPWQQKTRKVPYSIADVNLFPVKWQVAFRLLVVSREDTPEAIALNSQVPRRLRQILKRERGVVIFYPEGGRTFKGEEFIVKGDRRVRRPRHELVALAKRNGAAIIPVWVDHGDCTKERELFTSYRMLFLGQQMTIHFGRPMEGDITSETVAQALLCAGREAG